MPYEGEMLKRKKSEEIVTSINHQASGQRRKGKGKGKENLRRRCGNTVVISTRGSPRLSVAAAESEPGPRASA